LTLVAAPVSIGLWIVARPADAQVAGSLQRTVASPSGAAVPFARVSPATGATWTKTYGGNRNTVAGSLLMTDDGGLLIWEQTYGKDGFFLGQSIIRANDGNLLIAGVAGSASTQGLDACVFKVDPNGEEIWRSTFGEPDMIDYGMVLVEAAGGGYVAAGEHLRAFTSRNPDITLVKVDENGQLLWRRNQPAAPTMFSSILQHPDGGFIIAGAIMRESVFNIILIKTDSDGNMAE
jgi:hypothetical protein